MSEADLSSKSDDDASTPARTWNRPRTWCILLIALHATLLAWSAASNSVTFDEYARVPAGVTYLKYREFEILNLAPPLLSAWAATPVVLAHAEIPPIELFREMMAKDRYWSYGEAFMRANVPRYQRLFLLARLWMIPVACLGLWIVYRWAGQLYGGYAGVLAGTLYALCPNFLAHGSIVGTDVGIAVAILASAYAWWRFCVTGSMPTLVAATIAVGTAHLCKFNAVLVWPMLIAIALFTKSIVSPKRIVAGFVLVMLGAVFLFNLGYGFQGTGKRVSEYQVQSRQLGGILSHLPGSVRLPFPEQAILGYDALQWEVEQGFTGFLFGQAYQGSKWYYFPVALALKTPLAALALIATALVAARFRFSRDELAVIACAILFGVSMILVANVNLGVRYVLPVLPFAYILTGRLWRMHITRFTVALLLILLMENLAIAPRYLSFFNLLAGGPSRGQYSLNDSNYDWGQGLIDLKRWMDRSHVDRIQLGYFGRVDPAVYGVQYDLITQVSGEPFIGVSSYFLNGLRHRLPTAGGSTGPVQLNFYKQLQRKPRVAIPGGTIHIFRRQDVADAMREAQQEQPR